MIKNEYKIKYEFHPCPIISDEYNEFLICSDEICHDINKYYESTKFKDNYNSYYVTIHPRNFISPIVSIKLYYENHDFEYLSLANEQTGFILPNIIKYDRFRPNIVIDGIEPYLEDDINKIYLNGNILIKDTLCKRCYTTTIDIKNNKVDRYLEPMKTLLKYRKFGNNINFGLLLNLELNLNGIINYKLFNLVI